MTEPAFCTGITAVFRIRNLYTVYCIITICPLQDAISTMNLLAEFKPKGDEPNVVKMLEVCSRAASIYSRRCDKLPLCLASDAPPPARFCSDAAASAAKAEGVEGQDENLPASQESLATALGRTVDNFLQQLDEQNGKAAGTGTGAPQNVCPTPSAFNADLPAEPKGSMPMPGDPVPNASGTIPAKGHDSTIMTEQTHTKDHGQPCETCEINFDIRTSTGQSAEHEHEHMHPHQPDDASSVAGPGSDAAGGSVTSAADAFAAVPGPTFPENLFQCSDDDKDQSSDDAAQSLAKRLLQQMKHPRATAKSAVEALDYVPDLLGKIFNTSRSGRSGKPWDDLLVEDDEDAIMTRLNDLADDLSSRTTSIAFAGVAAHDVTDRCLAQFLSGVLGRQVCPPKSQWLIEKSSACQEELMILHSADHNPAIYSSDADRPCMYSDIMQFWRPEIKEIVDCLMASPHLAIETMATLLVECRAVKLTGWCNTHGKYCQLRPCSRHSAGSVCTPYSSQGNQLALNDASVLFLLCWNLACSQSQR